MFSFTKKKRFHKRYSKKTTLIKGLHFWDTECNNWVRDDKVAQVYGIRYVPESWHKDMEQTIEPLDFDVDSETSHMKGSSFEDVKHSDSSSSSSSYDSSSD